MVGHSISPSAASFIRPSRKSDPRVSFLDALRQKYGFAEVAKDAIQISGKTVEEVGFEKIQSQLHDIQQLETVILDSRCIYVHEQSKASQAMEIASLRLKIRDLDLSQNLFEKWDDVLSICSALEHLRHLSVAGNRFADTGVQLTSGLTHTKAWLLDSLDVAYTLLSWEEIMTMVVIFPSLRSLNAAGNGISRILQPLRHEKITMLDLSFNLFVSLQDLIFLPELPQLDTLSLRSNPLKDFSTNSPSSFNAIRRLNLSGTGLSDFNALHSLSRVFPSLTSLQTKDTPMSKLDSATLNTTARLPTLTELNYSTISAEERQNAELYYLGTIVKELENVSDKAEESKILLNHPRWDTLCRVYGAPTIRKVTTNIIDPNTLAARLTRFTFYVSSPAQQAVSVEEKEALMVNTHDTTLEKSALIPRTTSCYALNGIVGKLFTLPPPFTTTIRLFHETDEWDPIVAASMGIGGDGDDDDGWSVSEDEDDEDEVANDHEVGPGEGGDQQKQVTRKEKKKAKGMMVLRTEELVPSTRPVGDWVTEREARVKVVLV